MKMYKNMYPWKENYKTSFAHIHISSTMKDIMDELLHQ